MLSRQRRYSYMPDKLVRYMFFQICEPNDHRKSVKKRCLAVGWLTADGTYHYEEFWMSNDITVFKMSYFDELDKRIFMLYKFDRDTIIGYSKEIDKKDVFVKFFGFLSHVGSFYLKGISDKQIYKGLCSYRRTSSKRLAPYSLVMKAETRDYLFRSCRIPWVNNDFRLILSNKNALTARRMKEVAVAVYYLMQRQKYCIIPSRKRYAKAKLKKQEEEERIRNEADQPIQGHPQADGCGDNEGLPVCESVGLPVDEQPSA